MDDQPIPFKILGLHHVGLGPKHPEQASHFLQNILKLKPLGEEDVADQKVHTQFFTPSSTSTASQESSEDPHHCRLELLSATKPDSPIAQFVQQRGGGIHHLALQVDNIANALSYLKSLGVELVDQSPRHGADNALIAFIHPRSTGGLLLELVQI